MIIFFVKKDKMVLTNAFTVYLIGPCMGIIRICDYSLFIYI